MKRDEGTHASTEVGKEKEVGTGDARLSFIRRDDSPIRNRQNKTRSCGGLRPGINE